MSVVGHVDRSKLEVPVTEAYPLTPVREAYAHLATGHLPGKIVLLP